LWEYDGLKQWIAASLRGVSLYVGISLHVSAVILTNTALFETWVIG
jgi:hypothetical protein